MVPLESEALAARGHHTVAVPHQERDVDPVTDDPRGPGDGANVHPVFDHELQTGVADELGRRIDADGADALDFAKLVSLGRATAQRLGIDEHDRPGRLA
jgi:hypothetical protein